MCGRFALFDPVEDLVRIFAVDDVTVDDASTSGGGPDSSGVRPRWNVAPTQLVLAVAAGEVSGRRIGQYRWGLVPAWAKDISVGNRMINARAETVATSGAFRSAFAKRRCLVPASGFYEWTVTNLSGSRPFKQPHFIRGVDGAPLALAGLWEIWRDSNGHEVSSCTVITTTPNATMAPIHDRMPVILPPSAWDEWLAPGPLDAGRGKALLVPAPDGLLTHSTVSTRVNNARNEGASLIEPPG